MKKHLMGFFALIIAIGLSAFTQPKKVNASNSYSQLSYWEYDPMTATLGSFVGVFDPSTEQSELETATCPDDGTIECARGFASPYNENNPPVGNQKNDYLDIVAHD